MIIAPRYFALIALVALVGCNSTAPIHKKGVAIDFKRLNRSDPNFDMPTFQGKIKEAEMEAATKDMGAAGAVGTAATTATVVGSALAVKSGGAVFLTAAAAGPAIAVTAVAAGVGLITGAVTEALMANSDCGDGYAHFTIKTAEDEIKTIRAARAAACQYKPGDVVNYAEDKTGIAIFPK